MKKFNEKLNKDITILKALHTKRDKTEFVKMKNLIMKKYNFGESTIYKHMKKSTPGLCNTASHHIKPKPVTEEEINMVRELLMKQFSVMQIRAIMETRTGDNYSISE
jgi:hypothetical protein